MSQEHRVGPPGSFSGAPSDLKPVEIPPEPETSSRWTTFYRLIPGLILIVLSGLFFLSNYGILKGEWWQYFLVLLLVVFLIEYWVEYVSPASGLSRFKMGLVGLLLIVVGILFLFNPNVWWPLILLLVGIFLLIRALILRSRTPGSPEIGQFYRLSR